MVVMYINGYYQYIITKWINTILHSIEHTDQLIPPPPAKKKKKKMDSHKGLSG